MSQKTNDELIDEYSEDLPQATACAVQDQTL